MTIADEPATEDTCNAFGESQSEREFDNANGRPVPLVSASNFSVGRDNVAIKSKHHIIHNFFMTKSFNYISF